MEMEEYHDDKKLEKEELERLKKEILEEARKVKEDYKKNPSEMSGSVVSVHENSPYLDTKKDDDNPLYSGSRWKKVLKGSVGDALKFVSEKNKKA